MSVIKIFGVLFYLLFINNVFSDDSMEFFIRNEKISNKTSDKFLSVALDMIVIAMKFRHFDMR